jgi:hypothetical protein
LVQTSPELALVVRSLYRVSNDFTAQLTTNHTVLSIQDRRFPETGKSESNNIISKVDLPNTTTPSLAVFQCSCGEGASHQPPGLGTYPSLPALCSNHGLDRYSLLPPCYSYFPLYHDFLTLQLRLTIYSHLPHSQ